jgi:hypothetical protein
MHGQPNVIAGKQIFINGLIYIASNRGFAVNWRPNVDIFPDYLKDPTKVSFDTYEKFD